MDSYEIVPLVLYIRMEDRRIGNTRDRSSSSFLREFIFASNIMIEQLACEGFDAFYLSRYMGIWI